MRTCSALKEDESHTLQEAGQVEAKDLQPELPLADMTQTKEAGRATDAIYLNFHSSGTGRKWRV